MTVTAIAWVSIRRCHPGGLNHDVVDVIGTNIGRSFIIGCRGKSQRTRRGIYGELGRISAATDRVASGLTGIRIGRRNRGHRGGVLGNRDRPPWPHLGWR